MIQVAEAVDRERPRRRIGMIGAERADVALVEQMFPACEAIRRARFNATRGKHENTGRPRSHALQTPNKSNGRYVHKSPREARNGASIC